MDHPCFRPRLVVVGVLATVLLLPSVLAAPAPDALKEARCIQFVSKYDTATAVLADEQRSHCPPAVLRTIAERVGKQAMALLRQHASSKCYREYVSCPFSAVKLLVNAYSSVPQAQEPDELAPSPSIFGGAAGIRPRDVAIQPRCAEFIECLAAAEATTALPGATAVAQECTKADLTSLMAQAKHHGFRGVSSMCLNNGRGCTGVNVLDARRAIDPEFAAAPASKPACLKSLGSPTKPRSLDKGEGAIEVEVRSPMTTPAVPAAELPAQIATVSGAAPQGEAADQLLGASQASTTPTPTDTAATSPADDDLDYHQRRSRFACDNAVRAQDRALERLEAERQRTVPLPRVVLNHVVLFLVESVAQFIDYFEALTVREWLWAASVTAALVFASFHLQPTWPTPAWTTYGDGDTEETRQRRMYQRALDYMVKEEAWHLQWLQQVSSGLLSWMNAAFVYLIITSAYKTVTAITGVFGGALSIPFGDSLQWLEVGGTWILLGYYCNGILRIMAGTQGIAGETACDASWRAVQTALARAPPPVVDRAAIEDVE